MNLSEKKIPDLMSFRLRYPIILFMFIFMTQRSEKTLMIPYQPIQQSI